MGYYLNDLTNEFILYLKERYPLPFSNGVDAYGNEDMFLFRLLGISKTMHDNSSPTNPIHHNEILDEMKENLRAHGVSDEMIEASVGFGEKLKIASLEEGQSVSPIERKI